MISCNEIMAYLFRKKLNEVYEETMMKKGEMDERMFIPADVRTVFDDAFDGRFFFFLSHSTNVAFVEHFYNSRMFLCLSAYPIVVNLKGSNSFIKFFLCDV